MWTDQSAPRLLVRNEVAGYFLLSFFSFHFSCIVLTFPLFSTTVPYSDPLVSAVKQVVSTAPLLGTALFGLRDESLVAEL